MFALCLVFMILVASTQSIKDQIPSASDVLSLSRNGYDPKDKAYRQEQIGLEITKLDDDNYIERPCEVYDISCIRKYFAEHSCCRPTYGPAPDPLFRSQSTFYVPRVNLTVSSIKLQYNGINGRISDFYINKRTDKLVLSVDFENFRFYSIASYFIFHRVGREPIVNRDFFNVTYPTIDSTIIIPNIKDLQLQNSEVFSYINNNIRPVFIVGPDAFPGLDPQLLITSAGFLDSILNNVQEGFVTETPFYVSSFIQYNICDFGIIVD